MKSTAQIDSAGRLVVPKAFRDALRLRPGDRLRVRTEGDSLVLEPEAVFAETLDAGDGWPLLKSKGKHDPLPLSYFHDLIDEAREHRHREATGDES
jgi:AbrB family looped-hinge helix DNA binding protein